MAKYKIIPSSRTIVHSPISIGHKAEKGVEAIEFDLTAWVETYGSGTLTVIMRRWGDAIPYPIALEIGEDNKATWTLSDIDTAKAGMAYAQLNYIVGDEVVKKSDIYTFRVMDSLTGEGEPPEAYESWLEHLTHLAAEAMAEVLDIEGIVTDKTLTVDGGIADAKATGEALAGKVDAADYSELSARVGANTIALAEKADQATTYTKTEVDALIDEVEVETDTTLEIAGAAADAAETGRQIGLIKAGLGALVPTNLVSGTYTRNKYVQFNTGDIINSATSDATDYIDVSECESIVYSKIYSTSTSAQRGIAFYDESKTYVSGVRCVLRQAEVHYEMSTVDVPENAKYVRLTEVQELGAVSVYNADDYNAKLGSRLTTAEADILELQEISGSFDGKIDDISADGYYTLPLSGWESGGWKSYTTKEDRKYRAIYLEPLIFDKDTYILADVGYRLAAVKEGGGGIGPDTEVLVPANTRVKVYARRFTEDTTATEDVEELASAIKIATALSPIELYKPTFSDVSMFERMGISGDSYCAGGGIVSGVTALTWGKNLERQAGITVDIYAKSGDSIGMWNVNRTKGLPALLAGAECGLYWFQHGINGTGSAEAIGTPADMEADPKPDTFYGQYAYALEAVMEAFPKARIVVASVMGSNWPLAQSQHRAANVAIKNIAEHYELPYINIATDDFFRSKFYSNYTASQHPTAMQAAGMAMAYRRLISKCIQDNPDYFINYGAD